MRRERFRRLGLVYGLALVVGLSACATSQQQAGETSLTAEESHTTEATSLVSEPTHAGTVTLSESGCTLEGSQPFPGIGEYALEVRNERDETSGLHVWGPISSGHTYADFVEHMEEEVRLTMAGEDFIGPPSWFGPLNREAEALLPGEEAIVVGFAHSGLYGIVCAGESAAWEDFRVFGYDGPIEITEPPPTVVLTETSCRYYGQQELAAGSVTIDLINESDGQFDLDLFQYSEEDRHGDFAGHVNEERRRIAAGEPAMGPPAYVSLVGEATVEVGEAAEFVSDMTSGSYAIVCVQFEEGEPVDIRTATKLDVSG